HTAVVHSRVVEKLYLRSFGIERNCRRVHRIRKGWVIAGAAELVWGMADILRTETSGRLKRHLDSSCGREPVGVDRIRNLAQRHELSWIIGTHRIPFAPDDVVGLCLEQPSRELAELLPYVTRCHRGCGAAKNDPATR